MFFSTRNAEGKQPRVTRQDIAMARDQGWWGKAITVEQGQIRERWDGLTATDRVGARVSSRRRPCPVPVGQASVIPESQEWH